eukprot:scaffold127172_cov38-Prasinocladus_malaysianus.AAC.1
MAINNWLFAMATTACCKRVVGKVHESSTMLAEGAILHQCPEWRGLSPDDLMRISSMLAVYEAAVTPAIQSGRYTIGSDCMDREY